MSPSNVSSIVREGQKALEELEKLERSAGSDVEIRAAYFHFLGALSSSYEDHPLLKSAAIIIQRRDLKRSLRVGLMNAYTSLDLAPSTAQEERRKHPGRS